MSLEELRITVIPQPVSSASEPHISTLLSILGGIMHTTLLAMNLPPDSDIRGNYEVIDISSSSTGDAASIAAFRFIRHQLLLSIAIRRRSDSVVLFFGSTSYLLPILMAKLSGKTVVLLPRGDVPLSLKLRWQRRMPGPLAGMLAWIVSSLESIGYRQADAILTYTPKMASQLGLERYSTDIYTNAARPVDLEKFSISVPFNERDERIGYLGRLDEEKNLHTIVEVVKHLSPNISFRFIGDGELRTWAEAELKEERLEGSVEFTGWVDFEDIPHQLNELKLILLMSEPTEGLPTVILEAFACGTPVIAPPVSGIPDVVTHEETGFILEDSSPIDIATVIQSILSRDDLEEISQSAREFTENRFTRLQVQREYRKTFESIMLDSQSNIS